MAEPRKLRGRFSVGNIPAFLLIIVFSCIIFIAMGLFPQMYTKLYISSCLSNPVLIFLNLLPIFLFMLFFYGLTAHLPFSVLLTSVVFLSMGLINNYKILFRNDPFVVSDLSLGRELIGILGDFDSSLLLASIIGIIILLILFFLVLFFFRAAKLSWWKRVIICLLCILTMAGIYPAMYTKTDIYDSLPVWGSIYSKSDQYSSKGWVYSFIYEIKKLTVDPPDGYDIKDYENRDESNVSASAYDQSVKPHVIMIMSEAFTDLSENENFDFTGYRDPLKNYKSIAKEAVVSGHLAVDVFGGGTATTEFEVLSAIDIDAFDSSTSPYDLIRKDFYCLPGIMNDLGYDTVAIHPGDGWFYNRDNVYDYMGFGQFLSIGDGIDENSEMKGSYISEAVTYDYINEVLLPYLENSDTPLFEFCVTIQNHGGYSMKYGEYPAGFNSKVDFEYWDENQLSNYFCGVIDADEELGDFIDSLKDSDEPVVVVYWGDHYPSFKNVYAAIGYGYQSEESGYTDMDMFYTPFFIWQNDAAAEITPLADNAASLGLGHDELFNASFLGSTLLELLGFDDMSAFMSFANEVREEIPVKIARGYVDGEGNVTETLSADLAVIDEEYVKWSYYMMFDR